MAAVAAVLAAAIFGVAFAVDRALRENGVERADARLASALRASSDALNARVARASAEAERLATSRRVQRALAAEDRAELAAVTRATPDPVLLQTSGSLAIGRRVTDAVRRSATVGDVGQVTAFVPLDDALLARIERRSDARKGILAAPRATGLGALLPTTLVGSGGDRRRWVVLAALATLATIVLLALAWRGLFPPRGGRRGRPP